jgi:hypothetical protein
MNLRQFQEALLTRYRATRESKEANTSHHGQAKVAASKSTEKEEKDPSKNTSGKSRSSYASGTKCHCKYCDSEYHTEPRCWFKDPTNATSDWADRNRSRIDYLRRKHQRSDTDGDNHIQEPIGNQPALAQNAVALNAPQNTVYQSQNVK